MALFKIEWSKSTLKDFTDIPKKERLIILKKIESLSTNPHPLGSLKLECSTNSWRFRYGNYRVIYNIEDTHLIILIIKVGHRKEVYT